MDEHTHTHGAVIGLLHLNQNLLVAYAFESNYIADVGLSAFNQDFACSHLF